MKGVSFQNGVEFKVVIEGETWSQGDTISIKLESVARNATAEVPALHVFLAESTDRKVKAKSPNAFDVIDHATGPAPSLACSFKVPLNASITDKSSSIYALYGSSEALETLGNLRLNIVPHLHLRDLIELMGTHFRFAYKSMASRKSGAVEVKFDPPASKEWSMLDHLIIAMELTEEAIELAFHFHRNEVDAMKSGLATKKAVREVTRSWELKHALHDFNQRLNKEVATAAIDGVIADYRDAGWLNS